MKEKDLKCILTLTLYLNLNLMHLNLYCIKGALALLADRTNGRAIATLLRLSSVVVVCNVMYCG